MSHPLAALIEAVRRELAALERDPAPTSPEAQHSAAQQLRRAGEAVATARRAARRVP